ncbi:MAG TPA: hypothetical protein VLX61_13890 [Anaerolineales bacterium]|nr:hypothetical protein [Anaerolineales bacterium]
MPTNVKQLAQIAIQVATVFIVFALALFIPAGTFQWLAGWIFPGLFLSFAIFLFWWLYQHNPGLLTERMRLGASDQAGWDKILFPCSTLIFLDGWSSWDWTQFVSVGRLCRFGCKQLAELSY